MSGSTPTFPKLNGTNYTTWAGDMQAWLHAQGTWRLVSGQQLRPTASPLPPSSSSSSQSASAGPSSSTSSRATTSDPDKLLELQDAWDTKSDKAAGWIWLMLEQDQKNLISAIQGDPVAMWKKLADTYLQQKAGSRFNAYDDLFSIRKKEDESLQALISRTDEQMRLLIKPVQSEGDWSPKVRVLNSNGLHNYQLLTWSPKVRVLN